MSTSRVRKRSQNTDPGIRIRKEGFPDFVLNSPSVGDFLLISPFTIQTYPRRRSYA